MHVSAYVYTIYYYIIHDYIVASDYTTSCLGNLICFVCYYWLNIIVTIILTYW